MPTGIENLKETFYDGYEEIFYEDYGITTVNGYKYTYQPYTYIITTTNNNTTTNDSGIYIPPPNTTTTIYDNYSFIPYQNDSLSLDYKFPIKLLEEKIPKMDKINKYEFLKMNSSFLYFKDHKSDKYYNILMYKFFTNQWQPASYLVVTHYGRAGTPGKITINSFNDYKEGVNDNYYKANSFRQKLLQSKLKKGYKLQLCNEKYVSDLWCRIQKMLGEESSPVEKKEPTNKKTESVMDKILSILMEE